MYASRGYRDTQVIKTLNPLFYWRLMLSPGSVAKIEQSQQRDPSELRQSLRQQKAKFFGSKKEEGKLEGAEEMAMDVEDYFRSFLDLGDYDQFFLYKVSSEAWNPVLLSVLYDKYKLFDDLLDEYGNQAIAAYWIRPASSEPGEVPLDQIVQQDWHNFLDKTMALHLALANLSTQFFKTLVNHHLCIASIEVPHLIYFT